MEETGGDLSNFCVNVRGSKCEPKSMLIEMKTHGQVITQTESRVIGVGSDSR